MQYLQRGIEAELLRRLSVEPLVILEGARTTGKTRLIQHAVENEWLSEVRSFLNESELAAAKAAPFDYVNGLPHGTAIDEAQLCEAILLPLKQRIEQDSPGAFVLTGSTRLRRDTLGGSDPLAGRTGPSLQLGPLTLGERTASPIQLIPQLFDGEPLDISLGPPIPRSELLTLVTEPGLPGFFNFDPADAYDRSLAYVRQVTSLPAFSSLDVQKVNQLTTFLAGRTSTLVNSAQFAAATETARATVDNYLARLEEALLILRLRGWRRSKDKSETDRAKIHFFDAGIASALARMRPDTDGDHLGRLAETLVTTEVIRQCGWLSRAPDVYHWRRNEREEVDLILEHPDGQAVCVEIKTSEKADLGSFRGIDAFRRAHPSVYHRGFVFYSGERVLSFGDERWAVPFSALRGTKLADRQSSHGEDAMTELASAINERRRQYRQVVASRSDSTGPYLDEAERQLTKLADQLTDYGTTVDRSASNVSLTIWHRTEATKSGRTGTQLIKVTGDSQRDTISVRVPKASGTRSERFGAGAEDPGKAVSNALSQLVDSIASVLAELDNQHLPDR